MPTLSFLVPPEWAGRPVKEFAKKHLGLSARVLAQGKRLPGGITLNGQPVFVSALLKARDELSFSFEEEPCPYPPAPLPLPILYEDESLLVADKPSAMPVHPSPGHDRDSLVNAVAFHYQQTGQSHLIRPLYRLDKDTSGLIALGKHRAAVSSAIWPSARGCFPVGGRLTAPSGLRQAARSSAAAGRGSGP